MLELPLKTDFTGKVVVVTGAGRCAVRRYGKSICTGRRKSSGTGFK